MEYRFPDKFWWGSATSAHQVEGNNHNDWTEWEKGRPPEFRSGKACDSYTRYEEDFDIAKSLSQNIHRFSIEWSRIEPKEGQFDHEAMHHYVNVVKALRERGIEPMITLWHFTNPVWFAEKGGFINPHSPEYFTRYVKYVVDNLKDRVGLWITFNEGASVYAGFSYLNGKWPPNHRNVFEFQKVRKNLIRAQTLAYQEIKKLYVQLGSASENGNVAQCQVGLVESNTFSVHGSRWDERKMGEIYNYQRNLYFWDKALPYYDFLGLNYYHVDRWISGSYSSLPKQDWISEMGWELYPKGIYHRLIELKKFKKPIFITENGIADSKDETREKYIKEHLRWVWQAIHDGVDVRGYLFWSLLDNFEWHHGFGPRFGLVEVDFATLERKIRPSALEYAKICKENALEF